MREAVAAAVAVAVAAVGVSCSTVMTQVGKAASSAAQGSTGNIEEVIAQAKVARYGRNYPFTDLEAEYLAYKGVDATSIGSHVRLVLRQGWKFVEVAGTVQCNGQDMYYAGWGTYILEAEVEAGDTFTFHLAGAAQGDEQWTETYDGTELRILKPTAGDEIDISEGFEIEWTPGGDPQQHVQVTLFVTQLGIQKALPLWSFPDLGRATITRQMLAEVTFATQKIQPGANYVIVERERDEVRYVLAGDAVAMQVSGDAVPVTVAGEAPKAKKPVMEGFAARSGDVILKVAEAPQMYNPPMAQVGDLATIGLSSLAIQGRTGVTMPETRTMGIREVSTIHSWGAEFGEEFLTATADAMADLLMAEVSRVLDVREVPTERIVATPGYQRINQMEVESDPNFFYATARGTTALDGLKKLGLKIGGSGSWFYDMMKASGSDALMEVYLTLARDRPAPGKEGDFAFKVSAAVSYRANPTNLVMSEHVIPEVTGSWRSEKFTGTDLSVDDFLGHLKYGDFVTAYGRSLRQLQTAQAAAVAELPQ